MRVRSLNVALGAKIGIIGTSTNAVLHAQCGYFNRLLYRLFYKKQAYLFCIWHSLPAKIGLPLFPLPQPYILSKGKAHAPNGKVQNNARLEYSFMVANIANICRALMMERTRHLKPATL